MQLRKAILLIVTLALLPFGVGAQSVPNQVNPSNATGTMPYNTYGGVRENINLATGNVNLQIPLLTLPGRNGHNLTLAVEYDSKLWFVSHWMDEFGVDHWFWESEWRQPALSGGTWRWNLPAMSAVETQVSSSFGGVYCYTNFVITMGDGSKHWFKNKAYCYGWAPGGTQVMRPQYQINVMDSNDGSYLRLDTTNTSDVVLHARDGTQTHFNPGYVPIGVEISVLANKIVDTNGNVISISGGITDTLGRVVTFNTSSVSYKDSSGTTRTISLNYAPFSMHPVFVSPASDWVSYNQNFLSSLVLPNGRSYTFQYNEFGELTKITYPTGGYTAYEYDRFTFLRQGSAVEPYAGIAADFREVVKRRVCRKATGTCLTTEEDVTTYAPTVDGAKTNNQYMDVTDPEGNRTQHQFSFQSDSYADPVFPLYSTRELNRWVYQGASTLLRTIQTEYNELDAQGRPTNISLPIRVTTTLNDSNQVTKVEYGYDTFTALVPTFGGGVQSLTKPIDNIVEQPEYGFGVGTPGALARKTVNTWLKVNSINGQDYTATSLFIMNRKGSEAIYDGAGNLKAQNQFEYDSYAETTAASGAVQHDPAFNTSYTTRGNLTASKRWRNTDAAWLETRNRLFDDAGNVLKTRDPGLHVTQFSYTDSWANQSCLPSGGSAKAYVTSATNALNQVTSSTYNSCSGTVATTTDPNNQTASSTYDLMGRMTQTNLPGGGQSNRSFSESATPLSLTGSVKIDATRTASSTDSVDGLGRVTQSRLDTDPQGVTYTDITYDALERKKPVSNPYRTTGDPTYGVTSFGYDALSRLTAVAAPSGGSVTTVYAGNCTTVTDQAAKKRKSCGDALGRLTQVFEDPGGLNYETDYQYDTLDNLTSVVQSGSRQRTFAYNSLSQLTSASNPESGTISYTYDSDGNLLTKVSPLPSQPNPAVTVTATFAYDSLHRLTGKTYSSGDPATSYFYDQTSYNGLTITNGVGRRTGMADPAGAEAWSYSPTGLVLTERRTTNSVSKNVSYGYNLDGSVASITYPSGALINYALSASYSPHGALSSLVLGQSGSFTGINLNLGYTNRLQPSTIRAWSTNGTALDFTYCFNVNINLATGDCGAAPVVNNGNVVQIKNNLTADRTQNFTYDALNRIQTAKTQATTGTYAWGLQFGYDPWANLLSASVTQGNPPMLSLGVNTLNRITNGGFSYDAAGNLLADGSFNYTWDAESKMKTGAGLTYIYDGDGKRAQKANAGTPPQPFKLYWYGMGSDPLDETDAAGNTNNVSFNEYIFFGGKRIARRKSDGTIHFYFADHLGTSRVVTSATGTVPVLDDSDFYPFGGERVVLSTSGNNYKFTGKERDNESGLDNFGARYFASTLGRFQSPDPLLNSGRPWQPQSWNRYAYTLNNPINFVDPFGLYEFKPSNCALDDTKCHKKAEQDREKFRKSLQNLEKARDKYKRGSREYKRLDAVLKTYGEEGVVNGIVVGFGYARGAFAATQGGEDEKVHVTLDLSLIENNLSQAAKEDKRIDFDVELAGVVAHEGVHAEEIFLYGDAYLLGAGREAVETSAFGAQSFVNKAFNTLSPYGLWNPAWARVDERTQERRRTAAVKLNAVRAARFGEAIQ